MSEQAELNFAAKAEAAASRLPELRAALSGKGWRTAKDLAREGFSDRDLRLIVEHDQAGEIFSHPGSPGYKLTTEVTLAEFQRSHSLKTQGEAMLARWVRYQRRYHEGRPA